MLEKIPLLMIGVTRVCSFDASVIFRKQNIRSGVIEF